MKNMDDLTIKELIEFCKNKRRKLECNYDKCPFYHDRATILDCDSGIYNKAKWNAEKITKFVRIND